MNNIFFQFTLCVILVLGSLTPALSMEESTLNKERKTYNPQFFGSSHELSSKSPKLHEHLTNIRVEASLYLELYKHHSAILQYTHEMKDYLSSNHYYTSGFEYADNTSPIQLSTTEKNSNQEKLPFIDTYTLTSPEGKAAFLQAKNLLKIKDLNFVDICDIDLKSNPLKTQQFLTKTQSFIARLVSSQNSELCTIGKWLKFSLANKKRNRYYNSLLQFRNLCINKPDLPQCLEPLLNKFAIVTELMFELTHIALCNFNNYEAQKEFADHLANAFDSAELNNTYLILRKELFSYFTNKKFKNRRDLVNKYGTPLFQCSDFKATFPSDLLSKKLFSNESEQTCLSHIGTKIEDKDEWILHVKKPKGKRKKNASIAKKKKTLKKTSEKAKLIEPSTIIDTKSDSKKKERLRKTNVRNSVLCNSNFDVTILEPALYDSRVLKWFNEEIKEKKNYNNRSVLYHTFPFVADHFIFKYGITNERENRSHPGQKDTVYYMGGEIQYKKGKKAGQRETVLFTCSKDPRGICYHRGFNKKESSLFEEFESSEFKYQFPALHDEPMLEGKTITVDINDEIHKSNCRESYFCIEIDDERNGVMLVLYKSCFQEENENFVS